MSGETAGSGERAAADGTQSSGGVDVVGRHRRLVRRTAVVSVLTLVSRILGFVREMISAALFGDRSGIYDAFITAWRVPNLFRRFLGEGAISTSFQTALTEVDSDHGEDAGRTLLWSTLRLLLALLIGICLVVMALVSMAPDVMPGTGWHWLGADPGAVRELTLRLTPFVVLICVAALFGGALHVRGAFGAPALAPVALNIAWIIALVVVAVRFGWHGPGPGDDGGTRHLEMTRLLAWGVLAAGTVQLFVLVPALRRTGLLFGPRPPRPPGSPGAGAVLRRAAPLALGAAVYQINVMIDGLMAEGLLPDGGPTIHYLANRVQQFPLALIAMAATSAVFPALKALGHTGDRAQVRRLHDRTHLGIAFVALPASLGLAVLARPVVEAAFGHGAFSEDGVVRATRALQVLCLAILPAGATGLIARTYYAMGDFKKPVQVSIAMLVTNVGLNVLFLVTFGMDVDGLALATALTSWGNVILLWPGLTRRLGLPGGDGGALRGLAHTALAASLAVLAAAVVQRLTAPALGEALPLLAAIGTAACLHLLLAHAMGVEEARSFVARLRRRFSR